MLWEREIYATAKTKDYQIERKYLMKTYYEPKTYYSIKHMKTFDITCNLLKCRGAQNLEAEIMLLLFIYFAHL